MIENYEIVTINKFIKNGDVVFDIGAHIGKWSEACLLRHKNLELHCFEPMPNVLPQLVQTITPFTKKNNIFVIRSAVSDESKLDVPFYCLTTTNTENSQGSTFHPELFPPGHLEQYSPKWVKVNTIRLDDYCTQHKISFIDFVKIDVEHHQMAVFHGAADLLRKGCIYYIQFESVKQSLCSEIEYLSRFGYDVGMVKLNPLRIEDIDYNTEFYNYLAWRP